MLKQSYSDRSWTRVYIRRWPLPQIIATKIFNEKKNQENNVKKHQHWNGKLGCLINWLGYWKCQNKLELKDLLSPIFIQEYFQQSSPITKPMEASKICMIKIYSKETIAKPRCYVSPILIILYFSMFWTSFAQAESNITPILNLGLLYDYSQPRHLGIFGYPSLKNYLTVCYRKRSLYPHLAGNSLDAPQFLSSFQSTTAP